MDERTAFLKEITEAFGPPGLEDDVAAILRRRTEDFCEVGRDNIGSFIAAKKGTADTPRILIAGHMDEVGFMVSDVESSGPIPTGISVRDSSLFAQITSQLILRASTRPGSFSLRMKDSPSGSGLEVFMNNPPLPMLEVYALTKLS